MRPVVCMGVAIAVTALAACTANDDIHTPAIAAITPDHAMPGAVVALSGSYFCAQPEPEDGEESDPLACENMGTVSFDEVPGTVTEYTDTRITTLVPRLPRGGVRVRVAVAGRTSMGRGFTVDLQIP